MNIQASLVCVHYLTPLQINHMEGRMGRSKDTNSLPIAGKYQFTVTLTVRESANGNLRALPFLIQTSVLKKAITDNINYQCVRKGTLFLNYLPFGLCHFAAKCLMHASLTLLQRERKNEIQSHFLICGYEDVQTGY